MAKLYVGKVYTKMAALAMLALLVLSILPAALASPERDRLRQEIRNRLDSRVGIDTATGGIAALPGQREEIRIKERAEVEIKTETSSETGEADKTDSDETEIGQEPTADESTEEHTEENADVDVRTSNRQRGLARALERVEGRSEVAAESIERAEEHLQLSQKKFMEAKQRYEEALQRLAQKKSQLAVLEENSKKCKEDTEECKSKKYELKRSVRERLAHTIELIDHSQEKLLAKVEGAKTLSEEEKKDAVNRIQVLEAQLTAKKEEIAALGDDVSGQGLKAQIKELKKLWQEVRKEQRRIITSLISGRQQQVTDAYGRFAESVETKIKILAQQGADVSGLEDLLVKYQEKVEEVKAAAGEARLAWDAAKESGSKSDRESARKAQKQFRDLSKEARVVLRELLKEYKEVKAAVRVEATAPGTTEAESGTSAETEASAEVDASLEVSTDVEVSTVAGSNAAESTSATESASTTGSSTESINATESVVAGTEASSSQ